MMDTFDCPDIFNRPMLSFRFAPKRARICARSGEFVARMSTADDSALNQGELTGMW